MRAFNVTSHPGVIMSSVSATTSSELHMSKGLPALLDAINISHQQTLNPANTPLRVDLQDKMETA